MAGTFNPSDKSANITLSSGNLVASKDDTAVYESVRSTSSFGSTNKVYFEIIFNPDHGSAVGVGNSTATISGSNSWAGIDNNSIGWYSDGSVWRGGASVATVAGWSAGQRLCVAIDRVNNTIWFRVGAGNWNNSGTANPATNTGGISISALTGTLFAFTTLSGAILDGDEATITLSPAFTHTVPSGFTAIGAVTFYTLTAEKGTYALTGQAATFQVSMPAAHGTYTLTGVAAALSRTRKLVADQGTYALTGVAAAFRALRILIATSTNYTLTGYPAPLLLLNYERPESDISIGGWKTYLDGTTDLWDMINEASPDDADYIKSSSLVSGAADDVAEIKLSAKGDPQTDANHIVRYRYRKTNVVGTPTMNLNVRLLQGATQIAAWSHTNVGTSFVLGEQTLSSGEANSITDYGDLRLEFTAEAP